MIKRTRMTSIWLLPLFWMILIWVLSSIPDLTSGLPSAWDFFLRKVAHSIEFGLLAFFLYCASRTHHQRHPVWISVLFAFITTILYAGTDELHQSLVPGRVGSLLDVGIDATGILFFLYIKFIFLNQKNL